MESQFKCLIIAVATINIIAIATINIINIIAINIIAIAILFHALYQSYIHSLSLQARFSVIKL